MLLTIVYFNYIFNIPMLNESSQLVKIAALWKRKCFVTSSQVTRVLLLVELALIHVRTCIQAKLAHVTSYTIWNGQ